MNTRRTETEIEQLARMVQNGFADVQKQFDSVRGEMRDGFAEVHERFGGVEEPARQPR